MAKLKASIKSEEKLSGSITNQYSFSGSIQTVIKLLGSVDSFVRSLSMKLFIYPIVNIYTKVTVDRYGRANLNPIVNIIARIKGFKYVKTNILSIVNIYAKARVRRNANVEINFRPIFGKETTLGTLDSMSLDDLDTLLLGEMEFTEGVLVNVIKKFKVDFLPIVEISAIAYIVQYTKLETLDPQLLEDLDAINLGDLEETVI